MPRQIKDLPGPRPIPVLGNVLQPKRVHLQIEEWAREHGPFFRMKFGPRDAMGVCDAEVIRGVMRQRPEHYTRIRRATTIIKELGAEGVFAAEGDTWHRQRRLLNPSFHARHLDTFAEPIRMVTERLHRYWTGHARIDDPRGVDILADVMRYTVDVTSIVSFGRDLDTLSRGSNALRDQLAYIFEVVQTRSNSPVDYWKLPLVGRKTERHMARMRELVQELIDRGRESLDAHPERTQHPTTLLESMLTASDDEEARLPLSDEEVIANVLTIILAGEDTTANTITWMLQHLATHPEVFARARAEADAVLGEAFVPTLAQARQLQYIDGIAHETLRLTPPAPITGAQALHDDVVAGVEIPKGALLIMMTRLVSTSPRYFDEPLSFKPERWVECTPEERRRMRRHTMAFGSGPRVCIGRNLALLECAMAVAMVVRCFNLRVADPSAEVTEVAHFTAQPSGVRLRLSIRDV